MCGRVHVRVMYFVRAFLRALATGRKKKHVHRRHTVLPPPTAKPLAPAPPPSPPLECLLRCRTYRIAINKGVQTIDFYSAIGGVTCLLLGFSRRRIGVGGVGAGAKNMLSPWSFMAQGIAAGSVGYTLGNAVGLPVQKVNIFRVGFRGRVGVTAAFGFA